jgi:hypothetical protein
MDYSLGLNISDGLMILAVLLGPIIAVQLTRYLDNKREAQQRKLDIFRTLMATRLYNISWDHVNALNRIDVEFDSRVPKEKDVLNAWKSYLDLLNDKGLTAESWNTRRTDLFVDLLHRMALVLNYDFDKTHIKNSAYSPVAHSNSEQEVNEIRAGLIKVLKGEIAIPVKISGAE